MAPLFFLRTYAGAAMLYLWASLLVIANILCLALTLVTLPGNWLMLAVTAGVAWWQWDNGMFSVWTLIVVLVLAVIAELIEFLASTVGVKKSGGTRWSGVASLIGGVVGAIIGTFAIPIPVLGSLVGACAGAALAAWACEGLHGRTGAEAAKTGMAAGAGRLVGTTLKFAVGMLIWMIIAVAAFWP